jgi:hypothetical protein
MTQPKPRRWPRRTTQLDALDLSPFRRRPVLTHTACVLDQKFAGS